jgi:molecular chaperone DnaK (HSP70)
MSGWVLAIDFGTTSTAAAMRFDDRVQLVAIDGAPHMPSMVFWREGTVGAPGELILGRRVENLASRAPWCLERTPKRRIGEEFMQLGEQRVRVTDAISEILLKVASEASRLRGGQRPGEVRLTHPVRWGEVRLAQLRRAAAGAGFVSPVLLPEPVAAATYFASERLAIGEHVAVYDLGGGTFDTAVLKRTADGFEVVGRPGGREDLGGENFDDLLYRHLGRQLPAEHWSALRRAAVNHDTTGNIWREANFQLQREARVAKEILSDSPDYDVRIPVPVDAYLPVRATELKELIRADLEETVVELRQSIDSAGIEPAELAAIYLAGGSSRIPLVSELIKHQLGQTPEYLEDPKSVIALGAARAPIGAYEIERGSGVARPPRSVRADNPAPPPDPPDDAATRPFPGRPAAVSPPDRPAGRIPRRRVLGNAAAACVLGVLVAATASNSDSIHRRRAGGGGRIRPSPKRARRRGAQARARADRT